MKLLRFSRTRLTHSDGPPCLACEESHAFARWVLVRNFLLVFLLGAFANHIAFSSALLRHEVQHDKMVGHIDNILPALFAASRLGMINSVGQADGGRWTAVTCNPDWLVPFVYYRDGEWELRCDVPGWMFEDGGVR